METKKINSSSALIIVDVQNDFLPGGALGVPAGDQVIPVVNELSRQFKRVVATQDWHPADHCSFAANNAGHKVGDIVEVGGLKQMLWPTHCVQHTHGAALADGLVKERITRVFHKGTDLLIDSYSGFFDNGHRRSTGIAEYLRGSGISRVFVLGLATDYCVKFTALDAAAGGFETLLVIDGCRGVEVQPGDSERAITQMREAGIGIVTSRDVKDGEKP